MRASRGFTSLLAAEASTLRLSIKKLSTKRYLPLVDHQVICATQSATECARRLFRSGGHPNRLKNICGHFSLEKKSGVNFFLNQALAQILRGYLPKVFWMEKSG